MTRDLRDLVPVSEWFEDKEEVETTDYHHDSQRLGVSVVASVVFLVFVLFLVSQTFVLGVTVAQIGGMNTTIERLEGTDVSMYPTTGETSGCIDTATYTSSNPDPQMGDDSFAMIQAEMGGAVVPTGRELKIVKDFDVPSTLSPIEAVRITLTRVPPPGQTQIQPVTLGDVQFDTSGIVAEQMEMSTDVIMDDRYTPGRHVFADRSPLPHAAQRPSNGEFVLTGQNALLVNATGRVHLLTFEQMTMPGLRINLDYLADESNAFVEKRNDCKLDDPRLDAYLADFDHYGDTEGGGTVTATVNVTNPGPDGQSVTGDVELRVNPSGGNTLVDSQTLTVSGESAQQITLTWATDGGNPAWYQIQAQSTAGVDSTVENTSINGFWIQDLTTTNSNTNGDIVNGIDNTLWAYVRNPSRGGTWSDTLSCSFSNPSVSCGWPDTGHTRTGPSEGWVSFGTWSVPCGHFGGAGSVDVTIDTLGMTAPRGTYTETLNVNQNSGKGNPC